MVNLWLAVLGTMLHYTAYYFVTFWSQKDIRRSKFVFFGWFSSYGALRRNNYCIPKKIAFSLYFTSAIYLVICSVWLKL